MPFDWWAFSISHPNYFFFQSPNIELQEIPDNSLTSQNFKIPTFYMTLGHLRDCMTRVLSVGTVLIKCQLGVNKGCVHVLLIKCQLGVTENNLNEFWDFYIVALPFTLKSILKQKKNYSTSNISPCKNIIFKKSSKRN